jgi:hypothetical protein
MIFILFRQVRNSSENKSRSRVFNTPASYSEVTGSSVGYSDVIFVVFLSPSNQVRELYFKLSYCRFIPHSSRFSVPYIFLSFDAV